MINPRFRLRTLMIAVAAVALIMGGSIEGMRLTRFRRAHQRTARLYRVIELMWTDVSKQSGSPLAFREEARRESRNAKARRLKYERAARYPWLPVEPNPPVPK